MSFVLATAGPPTLSVKQLHPCCLQIFLYDASHHASHDAISFMILFFSLSQSTLFLPWVIVLHFTVSEKEQFDFCSFLEDMIHSLEFSGFVETTLILYLSVFLAHFIFFILFIIFGCCSLHFV